MLAFTRAALIVVSLCRNRTVAKTTLYILALPKTKRLAAIMTELNIDCQIQEGISSEGPTTLPISPFSEEMAIVSRPNLEGPLQVINEDGGCCTWRLALYSAPSLLCACENYSCLAHPPCAAPHRASV